MWVARLDAGGLFLFGDTSTDATPSPVPGTRSHAQAWTAHSSHRVPGTATLDR
jgi:hypothetical protein